MRIREDLFELLYDERKFGSEEPQLEPPVSRTAITVVMAANGYPETYPKGEIIEGLDEAAAIENVKIFHAGTLFEEGKVITNGGRVLNVTATGSTIIKARQTAYAAVDLIHWSSGPQFRTDIGQ